MANQQNTGGAQGYFEPEMQHTLLRGCRNCGGAHPLARKPVPVKTDLCPDCGHAVEAPGPTYTERAVLQGGSGIIANTFLSIGKALTNLSKRI